MTHGRLGRPYRLLRGHQMRPVVLQVPLLSWDHHNLLEGRHQSALGARRRSALRLC